MAATDGQIVVAASRWGDEGHYLLEFVAKNRLPTVVKIIKGQYGGIGVPTLPSPGLQSTALLMSAGRRHKITAQAVKLKEGRRMVAFGPRLLIPDSYSGYFELLSEEGRAMRCMESVSELARRRLDGSCLVREPIRAIVARTNGEGELTADGARTIAGGEIISPKGEIVLGGSKGKFLRCLDSRGDTVLLGMDQRGRFSALAKEDSISGVHTARNLLNKRMPLTVRLVHGEQPKGFKVNHPIRDMRLLSVIEEEHVFALPLLKESCAISLPLHAPLKLQRTKNEEQLKSLKEFQRLVEKCSKLVSDMSDKIVMLDGKYADPKSALKSSHAVPTSRSGYFIRRSASTDSANYSHGGHSHKHSHSHSYSHSHSHKADDSRVAIDNDEYDEIDQIYDYVRGFAPLPKNIRSPFAGDSLPQRTNDRNVLTPPTSPTSTPGHFPLSENEKKPEPPPIETIPTKKFDNGVPKAEKRTRRISSIDGKKDSSDRKENKGGLSKLYVKNGNSHSSRLFRLKNSSPVKEHPPVIVDSVVANPKVSPPLCNMRYKSLSNIQQAMEMDGTLDSSHSGGRTSGDSGGCPKLPEKRSRKLSRPKSLTNLVWELRGGQGKVESSRKSCGKSIGPKKTGTLYL